MCRAAALAVRNWVVTVVMISPAKSSSAISAIGVPCTELCEMALNEMSMPPARAATSSACASTARSSSASTIAVSAAPPAARICSATASSVDGVRPARWTVAPSRPKALATAPPMAPPPP